MSGWLFFFYFFLAVTSKIVLPTSSSTDNLLSMLPLFSRIHRASSGLNTSFSLALIFFLLRISSCTHLLFFFDRSYNNPCLFLPPLFWFDDDRRFNSWNTLLLGASFKSTLELYVQFILLRMQWSSFIS